MSSTASTEPAATSEQPARSPAKARKYNFGKPGGPRKSRRNSLEHKHKKPGKNHDGQSEARLPPEIRYEPLPLLPTAGPREGKARSHRVVLSRFGLRT